MRMVFKVSSDSEETIDNILSSLLPHANFDVTEAKSVVEEFFRTLPLEETEGLYYVFLKTFSRLNIAHLYMRNVPTTLRRDVFENAILSGANTILLTPEFEATRFFGQYNKNYDLNVPAQFEEAMTFLYSVCMEKYDELFEKAIATTEGMIWVNLLKQQLEQNLTAKMISTAAAILTEGITTNNTLSKGPEESRKYLAEALTEVNNRVMDIYTDYGSLSTGTSITSLEASKQFDERNKISVKDLFYTGIDPIDDLIPVRTQDIVTIVADEGIGKTRLAVDWTYRALMAGKNVLYICGETAEIKIKKYLECMHLYMKYGIQLSWTELDDPTTIPDTSIAELEDLQVKINASLADFYENEKHGILTVMQHASYETFHETIKKYKNRNQLDLVVVDHVLALTSTGAMTTSGRLINDHMRVNFLYECEDLLVKECNLAFLNLSHPSSQTSADLKAGKTPGARSGAESSYSTRYSSMVCVLNSTPELQKQDIVLLYVTKLRDVPNTANVCVLKRAGYANVHTYDPSLQYLGNGGHESSDVSDTAELFLDSED